MWAGTLTCPALSISTVVSFCLQRNDVSKALCNRVLSWIVLLIWLQATTSINKQSLCSLLFDSDIVLHLIQALKKPWSMHIHRPPLSKAVNLNPNLCCMVRLGLGSRWREVCHINGFQKVRSVVHHIILIKRKWNDNEKKLYVPVVACYTRVSQK